MGLFEKFHSRYGLVCEAKFWNGDRRDNNANFKTCPIKIGHIVRKMEE